MYQSCFSPYRGFAALDIGALVRNFCLLRERAREVNKNARVIAVVKANAYGHGMAAVLPALARAGCDFFAVATPDEALEARGLCKSADILVLGYTPPNRAPTLAAAGITQTVFSAAYGAALSSVMSAVKARLKIHLKIDGGMCRLGFSPRDDDGLLQTLRRRGLLPTGLYTHFPSADSDTAATALALRAFCACRDRLKDAGFPLFSHAAASAAALTMRESVLDAIRVGIALYGIPPTKTDLPLSPVLSLHAPIVQIRTVEAGTPIGYGGAFVTERASRIGVLPIGYADGFPRALSGLSVTLTHGDEDLSVPLVGRVCMDQLMLDLTDTPATVGDTVCLWRDATEIAARLSTIPYEVLTALSPRLAKIEKRSLL
ncbi:MAG: alanine racemase [Clostridia bacterium]|nr:alanine racemase [Clostridia bacterium]